MRFSVPMMLASLGVLGAFLLWFLYRSWIDERAALTREADLMLVSAVRGIEGAVFDRLLTRRQVWTGKTPESQLALDFSKLPAPPDSARVFILNERTTYPKKDSAASAELHQVNIKVKGPSATTTGALSLIIRLQDEDSLKTKVQCPMPDTAGLSWRLDTAFRRELAKSKLPVGFHLEQTPFGLADSSGVVAASYLDLANQKRYTAYLTAYNGYLLGRIAPQIAFALFLFSLVGGAFWLVYRSLLQQRRLTELKNDFIRNITHELKTPISTVSVAVEAMQNFGTLDNPARTREYLGIAASELKRLSILVDRVLRMSLFERAEPEIKPEWLDLRALVEEILATMRLQFEKSHAQVQFDSEPVDFTLKGDKMHLSGVVYNLIDNALKYSFQNPNVQVQLERSNGHALLSVRDSGIGIPSAYQQKIFETFFRVPTGDVHNVKGHGLGLSYVAGVIRQHQGSISVESKEGEGTLFKVLLPMGEN